MMRTPLILASQSASRKNMLAGAGLEFTVYPAHLDEDAITHDVLQSGGSARDVALTLAKEKALHVSKNFSGALVIGSDQVLNLEGALLSKAVDAQDAAKKIRALSGRVHELTSAAAVAKDGEVIWSDVASASMHMRALNDEEIAIYIGKAGAILTSSVGAYALEGLGAQLFEKVEGDYFTVLGMPLLPLLTFLRSRGPLL